MAFELDEKTMRDGRRALRALLPWARAELPNEPGVVELESVLGRTIAPYITEANLDALLIYPGRSGGWHADILLKNVPPGIPNTLGTPVGAPCRTRAEAEELGKHTLVTVLELARRNSPDAPRPPPVFWLHDWSITLVPEILASARKTFPDGGGYGSEDQAKWRVEQRLTEVCPNGFDGDDFKTWDIERKAHLLTVLHRAVLSGLFVYPMREPAPPVMEMPGPDRDERENG